MIATKTRRRRCTDCGELKEDVLGRQRLCNECEEEYDYCCVCNEYVGKDNHRHTGWNDGLVIGCGSNELDADDHKESFMILVAALDSERTYFNDADLLPTMRDLLRKNNLWTQWHGPMIGGPPDLAIKYEKRFPKHKSVLLVADIRSNIQESWGDDLIEAMQVGMGWLTSLDPESKEANQITADWIDEYLKLGVASNGPAS